MSTGAESFSRELPASAGAIARGSRLNDLTERVWVIVELL
jgi:hypothetical protein